MRPTPPIDIHEMSFRTSGHIPHRDEYRVLAALRTASRQFLVFLVHGVFFVTPPMPHAPALRTEQPGREALYGQGGRLLVATHEWRKSQSVWRVGTASRFESRQTDFLRLLPRICVASGIQNHKGFLTQIENGTGTVGVNCLRTPNGSCSAHYSSSPRTFTLV